jgi:hypothetical protein
VTLHDPSGGRPDEEFDGVQKVHAVHGNMAMGFAGNINTGFKMVSDFAVTARKSIPPECITTEPSRLLFRWARRARYHWANTLAPRERIGGCELLFVAARPPSPPFGITPTLAYVLRAPAFVPERAGWLEPVAIGSGVDVPEYVEVLRGVAADKNPLLNMGMPDWDAYGGPLIVLSAILGDRIRKVGAPGIAPHLVLCSVQWGSVQLRTSEGVGFEEEHRAEAWPSIARTIPEWQELKKARGLANLIAVTSPLAAHERHAA